MPKKVDRRRNGTQRIGKCGIIVSWRMQNRRLRRCDNGSLFVIVLRAAKLELHHSGEGLVIGWSSGTRDGPPSVEHQDDCNSLVIFGGRVSSDHPQAASILSKCVFGRLDVSYRSYLGRGWE